MRSPLDKDFCFGSRNNTRVVLFEHWSSPDGRLSPVARVHAPIHFRKGGRPGKVTQVTFEGLLRVRDSGSLLAHMENGIGHAKAFGCGLLLVRPVG